MQGEKTEAKGHTSEKGVITIYCSLVFLLMAALICAMLESAHQTGIRVRLAQTADAGLDSLLSMYDEALYEQYGLLFLNESSFVEVSIQDRLGQFMACEANANEGLLLGTPQMLAFELGEVCVDEIYYAVDDDGVFFEREVLELMKYQETAQLLNNLSSLAGQISNGEQAYDYVIEQNDSYENTDWEALAEEVSEKGTEGETAEAGEEKEEEAEEGAPVQNEDIEASLEGSIITQVQELLTDTLLSLFLSDVSQVSEKTQEPGENDGGISHGIVRENGFLEDTAEAVLFDEYLMQYFGSYREASEGGGLSYELEYILNGASSDKDNLLAVLTKLLVTRMGLNIIFLLSQSEYYQQAEALADTLVGWTGLVALVIAVRLLLIAVWAFAESVLDVRALLAGKKVPFFKSTDSWTSSISDCISRVASGEMAKETSSGITYEIYLRIFLLLQSGTEKCQRAMDIISWNMQKSRSDFSFQHCIYGLEITVCGIGHPVFGDILTGAAANGYEYQVNWAATY